MVDPSSETLERRIATGLHKIGLVLRYQTWLAASELSLSPTQGQILSALATDGPLTATELGRRIGVTLPTISDSARVLVEKGLASKRQDVRHPRASLIELTGAGRKRAAKVRAWSEFLVPAVASLPTGEQQAFLGALVKVIRALQENRQIPASRMCVTCVHFRPRTHDGPLPHHCDSIDAPLADGDLRLDCPEQAEASEAQREETWGRFVRAG